MAGGGGTYGTTVYDTVFVLDEESQAWETVQPLKEKRQNHATINLGQG